MLFLIRNVMHSFGVTLGPPRSLSLLGTLLVVGPSRGDLQHVLTLHHLVSEPKAQLPSSPPPRLCPI